ncbi:acyl-CoA dehydrogenase family protein [Hyphomonas jannaschiana]|jgi:alkylation response protein AidB-like acyl-CoA dehydrogenase|uniref:acyl-CoA dehydrogenase family protein n=1 Tax=Hyphomonas jannaschiana TaxID=86 RepID=UPI0035C74010
MDGSFYLEELSAHTREDGREWDKFCAGVDEFLDAELTEDLRAAGRRTTGLKSDAEACRAWREKLNARGWYAPTWPVEYGGAGWNTEQRIYFENASAARDAPILMNSGVRTIGPLIMEAGTPAQKAHYLPAILNGEHEWCQGFSEPQAGSDLSALSLKAERDGDDFILTGSKVWTSFAQYATHMFLLARCDPGTHGGKGLVFLLVEMDRPGIDVRPIRFIDGEYETNEVFFNGVRTPAADRIGEIGEGWKAAKQLMAIARGNNTTTGLLRRAMRAARRCAAEAGPLTPSLQMRFADLDLRIDTLEALDMRTKNGLVTLDGGPASSQTKLLATELHQAITEAALEAAPFSDFAQAKYLATRAATIYSGTSEVHRNILARAIGCP